MQLWEYMEIRIVELWIIFGESGEDKEMIQHFILNTNYSNIHPVHKNSLRALCYLVESCFSPSQLVNVVGFCSST